MRTNEMKEVLKNQEMMKTLNRVMLYPGKDAKYNLRAVPLRNSVIAGLTGSGKTMVMDNIMLRLITENSPESVQIVYWDRLGSVTDKWYPKLKGQINLDRKIPHISNIWQGNAEWTGKLDYMSESSLLSNIECEVAAREVKLAKLCKQDMEYVDYFNSIGEVVRPFKIFILEEFIVDETNVDILKSILSRCEAVGVFCIITTTGKFGLIEDISQYCKNRFCLRASEEVSNAVIGCNLASCSDMGVNTYFYYKSLDSYETPEKMHIPFIPLTMLMKLVGVYSTRVDNLRS